MKGRILATLFALPFAAVGAWMCWSIGATLTDAWRMSDWVRVEATLQDAGYERHSGDSTTYEAYARYTYEYGGRRHSGRRVAIAAGADNIGDFQRELGRRLQAAFERGETIGIWVDPDIPSDAVVDRSIRWGLVGFKSIFVIVFGGVGVGLLLGVWVFADRSPAAPEQHADHPWLRNPDWQTPTIGSSSRTAMWGAWAFAGLWNAISAIVPFAAYDEIAKQGNLLALVAMLFPAIGIGLLAWAIRRTREWRRFGPAPVTLDPFPGAIGGHVGGTIDLNLPFDPGYRFRVTLTCLHSYESGSGEDRSRRERARWQDAVVAHAEAGGRGTRLRFRFDVPEGENESDSDRDDSYYLWRLNLEAELPGADLDRSYEIPVYRTGERSRTLPDRAIDAARREQASIDEQAVRALAGFARTATGTRLFFPAGRHLGSGLAGLLFGGIFVAAGAFLVAQSHAVMGSVFAGVGSLVALVSLYMAGNSLEVTRRGAAIATTRRLLGMPVRRRQMRIDEIVRLDRDSNLQTQSGGKHVVHYHIDAVDRHGKRMVIAEGIRGNSRVQAAMQLIVREFGIRALEAERSPDGVNYLGPDAVIP